VLFHQQSTYIHALRSLGIRISNSPVRRALQRAGVSSLVDRSYLRRQAPLSVGNIPPPKAARWLVVEANGAFSLFDLPRIHTILISDEYQRSGADILESSLPRQDLLRLDVQASLRDAWETMNETEQSAAFVSGVVGQVAISGIITREQIEDYYLNRAEE
jgi:hypothetical protein